MIIINDKFLIIASKVKKGCIDITMFHYVCRKIILLESIGKGNSIEIKYLKRDKILWIMLTLRLLKDVYQSELKSLWRG